VKWEDFINKNVVPLAMLSAAICFLLLMAEMGLRAVYASDFIATVIAITLVLFFSCLLSVFRAMYIVIVGYAEVIVLGNAWIVPGTPLAFVLMLLARALVPAIILRFSLKLLLFTKIGAEVSEKIEKEKTLLVPREIVRTVRSMFPY